MKESYFWQTVRSHIPEVHWSRIENVAGSGIPDLNGCYGGKELWVELKMFRGKQISLRNSQLVWTAKHLQAGGDVVLIARKDDEIWVFEGSVILMLSRDPDISRSVDDKSVTMVPPPERALKIFHKPFHWEGLRHLLFGR